MATRFYFHAATSSVSGTLPSTEQSTRTSSNDVGPQSTNRSMNTTIGTGQTSITGNTGVTSLLDIYFTKFVSDPLNQTSIAANTWTYNFAYLETSTTCNFPAATGSPGYVNCYVWRPSTGTTVGTIQDGTTTTLTEAVGAETVQHKTFTGAAVSGVQAGDVIIFEVWFRVASASTGDTIPVHWYYDGTTVNTTNNSQTSTNHASFIETPEDITFAAGTTTVTQTSIQKYAIRKDIIQTTIHKYGMGGTVLRTNIQKYTILRNVALTSIQKYGILKYLSQTSKHKYDIRAYVLRAIIHKYGMGGRVAQTSTHKYHVISLFAPIPMTIMATKAFISKFLTKL